jgi:hypothetical protein
MSQTDTRDHRTRVLQEAVVSAYIDEIARAARPRPRAVPPRPRRPHVLAAAQRRGRPAELAA